MPRGDGGRIKNGRWLYHETVRNYLKLPEDKRPTVKEFVKEHRMTQRLFYIIQGRVEIEDKMTVLATSNDIREFMYKCLLGQDEEGELEDDRKWGELLDAQHREGKGGRTSATELWGKAKGYIVEKPPVQINANITIAQAALEIANEREGSTGRVVEVSEEPALLRNPVCEDSGSGEESNGSV